MKPVFKRILLKLSGEVLVGSQSYGIDTKVASAVAQEIKTVSRSRR
jgi:uridylate kinase